MKKNPGCRFCKWLGRDKLPTGYSLSGILYGQDEFVCNHKKNRTWPDLWYDGTSEPGVYLASPSYLNDKLECDWFEPIEQD